jgi:hypothetical protein
MFVGRTLPSSRIVVDQKIAELDVLNQKCKLETPGFFNPTFLNHGFLATRESIEEHDDVYMM